MPGAIMQLASYGAESHYLHGNPQITFFKQVFRRSTNFAMESIDVIIEGANELSNDKPTTYKIKIPRNGDLINSMYLRIDLPDIYSSINDEFLWTRSIGLAMINYVEIYIGGSKIERLTGEYMDINSQLTHSPGKRNRYKQMVGDDLDLSHVSHDKIYYGWDQSINNKFYNTRPSLLGRELTIPLEFWFMRNNGSALPLISLQYHDVEIEIEIKAVRDLYTIFVNDDSHSAVPGNSDTLNAHHLNKVRIKPNGNIGKYIYPEGGDTFKTWDLNPHIDMNYIFLDTEERRNFAQNTHEYIIEQVQYHNLDNVHDSVIMEIEPYHPCKEMIFTVNKNNNEDRNEWLNYTGQDQRPIFGEDKFEYNDHWWHASTSFVGTEFMNVNGSTGSLCNDTPSTLYYKAYQLEDYVKFRDLWPFKKLEEIPKITKDNHYLYEIDALKSAEIRFNGFVRQSRRNVTYFHTIQSYSYHTSNVEQPIYTYSFSLNPENSQPSGSCNFSKIKNFTLHLELKKPPIIIVNDSVKNEWEYNVKVYLINYNILKISNGLGGLVFAN